MREPGREKHKDIHRPRGALIEKHHKQTAAQRKGHLEMNPHTRPTHTLVNYTPGQMVFCFTDTSQCLTSVGSCHRDLALSTFPRLVVGRR